MAKKEITDKGFKIIRTTTEEMASIGSPCICDHCNNPLRYQCVYIAVLGHCVCEDCFEEWHEQAINYPEDAKIEERNYKLYAELLNAE